MRDSTPDAVDADAEGCKVLFSSAVVVSRLSEEEEFVFALEEESHETLLLRLLLLPEEVFSREAPTPVGDDDSMLFDRSIFYSRSRCPSVNFKQREEETIQKTM